MFLKLPAPLLMRVISAFSTLTFNFYHFLAESYIINFYDADNADLL